MKTHFLKFAFAATVSLASQNLFAAENKIALVIGNSIYADKSLNLKNPVNDAKDMKTALEKVGFTVLYQPNATADQIDELRNEFVDQLGRNKDSIGLFYYSGHGMQMDGVNYLIPSDAKISLKVDLAKRGYDVDLILGAMEEAHNKANIVILDACRDNPLSKSVKSLKGSKGLTADSPPQGTLVAYATKSGSTANDNPNEKNSLYTKYLKQYLFEPGAKILDALTKVRNAVMKEEPQQIPSEVNLLSDLNLCLAGCAANSTANVENSPPLLSFVSGANSVNQNKSYSVKFKATDSDGDLSKIFIDWGDDSTPTSKTAKNGSTLTFTHTYKFAGIYDLIATAIDKQNNESETVDKSVEVKEIAATKPIENPVVSVKIPNVSNINVSPSAVIYGNSLTFTAKLNADLPAGHSVKIDYGNGLEKMNGSGRNFSFKVTPSDLGSSLYSVGIYDSKDVLKSNQLTGNFSVSEAPPVVVVAPEPEPVVTTKGDVETFVSGSKTFSYTKIANDGSELPKTAKLGTSAKDWACTKDNNTGLIWEVKTDDGLRDKDKTYSNYDKDYPKCDEKVNGWSAGDCEKYGYTGKFGDSTNTDGFVKAVNKQGLCGAKDWRLPESEELRGLVVCSDGKYADLGKEDWGYICKSNESSLTTTYPTINTTYFPNTVGSWFWSSSPNADYSHYVWYVLFYYGYADDDSKYGYNFVRLVRG